MLNITHNKGYEFYKGNSIVAVLSEKGTPRPIWIINFKSIEELNELLKVKISNLDSDNKYCINFSLYYKDINDPSQREIESLFYLLIKK
jgi:hypothetical protein